MSPARRPTAAGHETWDAFWAEVSGGRTEVIRGVEVQVPTDMPLAMERRIEELRDSEREEDVAELVELLFGADVMAEWVQAGMGATEFQTVLTWGMAQAGGRDLSFGEALELVRSGGGEGKTVGPKGPNRAARRSAPAKPSAAGGGRSKRTSSGSTSSSRKTSRA
ncbi:hypothetical protein [Streptomyces cahuitamycinicus]|uniref:Tail assembly chaperone n=1 Tax=Streptomyces cahuitamycinicus TaxID=2070367 RepID=A0A2N8TMT7_9ACTN|nr:hypothetical protein [Streptomyces cahuitamycinicus]PNG20327.1 hypothetical protein C1J00_20910 [Streptomyces cahuitamycinicus]